jgi:hypothetical protein
VCSSDLKMIKAIWIARALFQPDRIDVISPLFEEAIHYCDSLGVDCISLTTMQDNKYQKIAESLGFFIAPYACDVLGL